MSRAPAMTDVARMAGVSHQTVSRVLNDHPSVRPATRQRVLEAIEHLAYRPNLAARALVTGRSRTLGVVALDTTLFGPVSMLYGIERAARAAGWYVSVVSLRSTDASSLAEALGETLERLALQGVAGVVAITPLVLAGSGLGAPRAGLPVVLVEGDRGAICRSSPSTSASGHALPPSICSRSATRASPTSPDRLSSSRPASAPPVGAAPSRTPARRCPRW